MTGADKEVIGSLEHPHHSNATEKTKAATILIRRQDIINKLNREDATFLDLALSIYEYQRQNNTLYRDFLTILNRQDLHELNRLEDLSFVPIDLFKHREIKTGSWAPSTTFLSSGTTAAAKSKHLIYDLDHYHANSAHIWTSTFGPIADYCFISLLPNYHDNPQSSLLSMVDYFMAVSGHAHNGSFLEDYTALYNRIEENREMGIPTVLFGVSFALLDYIDNHCHGAASHLIVIETGGMKKRRKEITRGDLHRQLKDRFNGARICSEYGMTECLSQLYSRDHGIFAPNDRMMILISDPTDPLTFLPQGHRGRINIVDLANVDTTAFIATDDIGEIQKDGTIKIYGRLSNSDLRGCNYLL